MTLLHKADEIYDCHKDKFFLWNSSPGPRIKQWHLKLIVNQCDKETNQNSMNWLQENFMANQFTS